jgi:hypothetical protein
VRRSPSLPPVLQAPDKQAAAAGAALNTSGKLHARNEASARDERRRRRRTTTTTRRRRRRRREKKRRTDERTWPTGRVVVSRGIDVGGRPPNGRSMSMQDKRAACAREKRAGAIVVELSSVRTTLRPPRSLSRLQGSGRSFLPYCHRRQGRSRGRCEATATDMDGEWSRSSSGHFSGDAEADGSVAYRSRSPATRRSSRGKPRRFCLWPSQG